MRPRRAGDKGNGPARALEGVRALLRQTPWLVPCGLLLPQLCGRRDAQPAVISKPTPTRLLKKSFGVSFRGTKRRGISLFLGPPRRERFLAEFIPSEVEGLGMTGSETFFNKLLGIRTISLDPKFKNRIVPIGRGDEDWSEFFLVSLPQNRCVQLPGLG